jgi:hypothetical protein
MMLIMVFAKRAGTDPGCDIYDQMYVNLHTVRLIGVIERRLWISLEKDREPLNCPLGEDRTPVHVSQANQAALGKIERYAKSDH